MTVDRWRAMALHLAGEPLPPLPKLPGRVHEMADEPLPEADRAEVLADPSVPPGEVAALLGITRQRVHQLRRAARVEISTALSRPSRTGSSLVISALKKGRCQ